MRLILLFHLFGHLFNCAATALVGKLLWTHAKLVSVFVTFNIFNAEFAALETFVNRFLVDFSCFVWQRVLLLLVFYIICVFFYLIAMNTSCQSNETPVRFDLTLVFHRLSTDFCG